jgi:acetate kinase
MWLISWRYMRLEQLLTINTGSSSLKVGLYAIGSTEQLALTVQVDRIGLAASRLQVMDARGRTLLDQPGELAHTADALHACLDAVRRLRPELTLVAIGHRVVHGGSIYHDPQFITDEMIDALQALVPIDPEHLPQALAAIQTLQQAFPGVPHVACFDTAFHHAMPRLAQLLPVPRKLWDDGLKRYGFHGLSYESIVQALHAEEPPADGGRVVIAHLGNGASMAAVRDGESVDTTMGFTPSGGLMMGTRAGDLDPGVLLYLLETRGISPSLLNELVNQEAGLLGVSGTSPDMRDLLEREATDPRAADAINLFCYQASKLLGGLVVALGGLDLLVFTGGIGEHAAPVRQRICAGLDCLGIQLDAARNATHTPIISRDGSPVIVRVMRTDEDLMIARHTHRLLARA